MSSHAITRGARARRTAQIKPMAQTPRIRASDAANSSRQHHFYQALIYLGVCQSCYSCNMDDS